MTVCDIPYDEPIENTPEVEPACIGGSVVEFSPATREARVRFPANAGLSYKGALDGSLLSA